MDSIDMVLKAYPELFEIYWVKDEFVNDVLKLQEIEETKKTINYFLNKFTKSTVTEINRIGSTFTNWYDEIVNAYAKNEYGVVLTNAMAESNNNYIQTLINIGYGYSNFEVLLDSMGFQLKKIFLTNPEGFKSFFILKVPNL